MVLSAGSCTELHFTVPASQMLFLARFGQSVSMETAVFIPTAFLSCTLGTAAGSVRNSTVLVFQVLWSFYCCLQGNRAAVLEPDILVSLYSRVVFLRLWNTLALFPDATK